MKLLSVSISVFGARKIVQQLFVHNKEPSCCPDDWVDKGLETNHFLQIFKETLVPWCLCGTVRSTSARLDLLLTLLDDECFSEQWHSVISYLINPEGSEPAPQSLELDQLSMLALLLEKARNELTKRKAGDDSMHRPGADPVHWQCELLESTAVALACSTLSCGDPISQFLW